MAPVLTSFSKFLLITITLLLGFFIAGANAAPESLIDDSPKKHKSKNITWSALFPSVLDTVFKNGNSISSILGRNEEYPAELSVKEWEADLDCLAAVIKRRVPYFEDAYGFEILSNRLDSIQKALPGQSKDQRIMSLYRLFQFSTHGLGHPRINPAQRAFGWRAIPLWPYRFSDGVYIMAAGNKDLIGSELLEIGNTPVEELYDIFQPYVNGDNRWHSERRIEEQFMRWANPLKVKGMISDLESVTVTVRDSTGTIRKVTVPTHLASSEEWEQFQTSLPNVPESLEWSPAAEYQDNREPFYRLSYDDSENMLHFEFNTVLNESDFEAFSDLSIADVADSITKMANTKTINKVVIDLRTNSGGNHNFLDPLVQAITNHPNINKRGKLYTLISWRTFSAAGSFAMELERKSKTLFVGQPGGFSPNHWGSLSEFTLPNTKISVRIPPSYFPLGMPESGRTHLKPDIYVPFSSAQHFSNVDSTMILVKKHNPENIRVRRLAQDQLSDFEGTYQASPLHIARIEQVNGRLKLMITGHALRLNMDEPGPALFLDSDLYPLTSHKLATDIRGVFLIKEKASGNLQLQWKGKPYLLKPVPSTTQSPVEYFRDGKIQQGAGALRQLKASGHKVGTNITGEFFTLRVDELLARDKPEEALEYAKLAVEFWPNYWLSHADLADAYKHLGREDKALQALQEVKKLAPNQYTEMLKYLDLQIK